MRWFERIGRLDQRWATSSSDDLQLQDQQKSARLYAVIGACIQGLGYGW